MINCYVIWLELIKSNITNFVIKAFNLVQKIILNLKNIGFFIDGGNKAYFLLDLLMRFCNNLTETIIFRRSLLSIEEMNTTL